MTERLPVELSKAYRLLNHGPTVIADGNFFETGEAFEVKS
ncbi:flavin reductase [Pandoraea terrigena]|uniref:Flavin reductase n=1 Tax=Pandoraea terrigena TaxID=2508292 RepID=A0A5E4UM81_9BURK|nr:flavin reductase [Pandoraea terrigena]